MLKSAFFLLFLLCSVWEQFFFESHFPLCLKFLCCVRDRQYISAEHSFRPQNLQVPGADDAKPNPTAKRIFTKIMSCWTWNVMCVCSFSCLGNTKFTETTFFNVVVEDVGVVICVISLFFSKHLCRFSLDWRLSSPRGCPFLSGFQSAANYRMVNLSKVCRLQTQLKCFIARQPVFRLCPFFQRGCNEDNTQQRQNICIFMLPWPRCGPEASAFGGGGEVGWVVQGHGIFFYILSVALNCFPS